MLTVQTTKEKFLTLSQISEGIRMAIGSQFGERLFWIAAEISDLNVRKGHCYLSLIEKLPGTSAPACELKGVIWANKFIRINDVFKQVTGTDLASGTRILFQAYVRYDVKWGLNLIVEDVEPAYTIGLIQQERDRTVAKLKAEGVYGFNKSLTFPVVPLRVAIISAKDSRGFEDFLNKLLYNVHGYRFTTELFSSALQGDGAPKDMVNRLIEIFKRINEFDIVVIVRGGGGAVDLNCFNDFNLSRAVARFPLPVLTGIGHTTNISVVDEVAHANRITPTDAADFIVERTRDFELRLVEFGDLIHSAYLDSVVSESGRLQQLSDGIRILTSQRLENAFHNILNFSLRFKSEIFDRLKDSKTELMLTGNKIINSTREAVTAQNHILQTGMQRLKTAPLNIFNAENLLLDRLESSTHHLDPLNVLKRGFSITRLNGKIISHATVAKAGDILITTLHEGKLESEVKRID